MWHLLRFLYRNGSLFYLFLPYFNVWYTRKKMKMNSENYLNAINNCFYLIALCINVLNTYFTNLYIELNMVSANTTANFRQK